MTTRSGKAYSERPASAEMNTPTAIPSHLKNPAMRKPQWTWETKSSLPLPHQDIFLPAQQMTSKVQPPNGHAIVRSDACYFKDWFSDHCPGLPMTPPDRISKCHAPTLETRECTGHDSPAWSDYDGLEDPYGEIPAPWTSRPPGKPRRVHRPSLTMLDQDDDHTDSS
ncbi:hypothetical protein JB92DRAFT_2826108 [Gautieria morchelliformis]|nr:hypothetical protein JB92DRAFT_2826108 [Gautieria morchelliformis]